MAKHFLHISDYLKNELIDILHLAKELKHLANLLSIWIFQKHILCQT